MLTRAEQQLLVEGTDEAFSVAWCVDAPIGRAEELVARLKAEDFSSAQARHGFLALARCLQRGEVPTSLTFSASWQALGGDPVEGMTFAAGPTGSASSFPQEEWEQAVSRVEEASLRWKLMKVCDRSIHQARDLSNPVLDVLDSLTTELQSLGSTSSGQVGLDVVTKELAEAMEQGREASYRVPTGIRELDQHLFARAGHLIYLAARPGMGKSALMSQWAWNAAHELDWALVCTFEMSRDETALRLARQVLGVSQPSTQDIWKINRLIADRRLDICDKSMTMEQISRAARSMKLRYGKRGAVFIDYFELVAGDGEYEGLAARSRASKQLAQDERILVVMLHQLSRSVDHRQDKRPLLADLRYVGEADANKVIFLYRESYYNPRLPNSGPCEVLVAKDREDGPKVVELFWNPLQVRFQNIQEKERVPF